MLHASERSNDKTHLAVLVAIGFDRPHRHAIHIDLVLFIVLKKENNVTLCHRTPHELQRRLALALPQRTHESTRMASIVMWRPSWSGRCSYFLLMTALRPRMLAPPRMLPSGPQVDVLRLALDCQPSMPWGRVAIKDDDDV